MSTRTANWVAHVHPGAPSAPSRVPSVRPPSTIYPESSVSNPDASRYTGRSSRARSAGPPPSRTREASYYSTPRPASSHHTHTPTHTSHDSGGSRSRARSVTPTPMKTYYAAPRQPIVARTSGPDGRTDSYMIIPAKGQRIEILSPTSSSVTYSSPSSTYSHSAAPSPKSPDSQPLLRRIFGKVSSPTRSASVSHASRAHSPSRVTYVSGASGRSRRNSTGSHAKSGSADWTMVSGGSHGGTRVVAGRGGSVATTRVTSASGRKYDVVYV
ncbi:hypothetical protein K439DRAFT_1618455 [Ramaria rubella]|nr:hypothetical protein K439DRAFT_1618455 [Ramaria rubella]